MIFTKFEIDNLYCFSNTCIDFTFPRKIKNQTIPGEFIHEREKFNVKRVCIFSGANASGKTSFGRLMCHVQNFFLNNERSLSAIDQLKKSIADTSQAATLCVEFATESNHQLHKLELRFLESENPSTPAPVNVRIASISILRSDSSQTARKKLDDAFLLSEDECFKWEVNSDSESSLLIERPKSKVVEKLSWRYLFAETKDDGVRGDFKNSPLDITVLTTILKSFDSSIDSVLESFSLDPSSNNKKINGFEIFFKNRASVLIDLEGEGTPKGITRLSRGTYEAISVAAFISVMKRRNDRNTIWFMDEKMAYSHSELEQSLVSVMIGLLGKGSQFFYTTHNSDILSMNLPVHSYLFFKKEGAFTQAIQPETIFKKNDRTLANAIKNDFFGSAPDSSRLLSLLDD